MSKSFIINYYILICSLFFYLFSLNKLLTQNGKAFEFVYQSTCYWLIDFSVLFDCVKCNLKLFRLVPFLWLYFFIQWDSIEKCREWKTREQHTWIMQIFVWIISEVHKNNNKCIIDYIRFLLFDGRRHLMDIFFLLYTCINVIHRYKQRLIKFQYMQ